MADVSVLLTEDDVAHVAKLARLSLSPEELSAFTEQLGGILAHAADVEALDLADVPAMTHPMPLHNVFRADVEVATDVRAAVMAVAPATHDNKFMVPAILGDAP